MNRIANQMVHFSQSRLPAPVPPPPTPTPPMPCVKAAVPPVLPPPPITHKPFLPPVSVCPVGGNCGVLGNPSGGSSLLQTPALWIAVLVVVVGIFVYTNYDGHNATVQHATSSVVRHQHKPSRKPSQTTSLPKFQIDT